MLGLVVGAPGAGGCKPARDWLVTPKRSARSQRMGGIVGSRGFQDTVAHRPLWPGARETSAASGRVDPTPCSPTLSPPHPVPVPSVLPRSSSSRPVSDGRDLSGTRGPRAGEALAPYLSLYLGSRGPGRRLLPAWGGMCTTAFLQLPDRRVQPGSGQLCSQGTSDRARGQS